MTFSREREHGALVGILGAREGVSDAQWCYKEHLEQDVGGEPRTRVA